MAKAGIAVGNIIAADIISHMAKRPGNPACAAGVKHRSRRAVAQVLGEDMDQTPIHANNRAA
ncbi:hypothetical protein JANAI62_23600 [Jannaschia pagri]|uniref:Uncharacterized protein n=1 Tax=Jannaschia pagri TaxID=2829797 RepID=A0ABQ4NMW2_9RHOB|nr:hypothetical protein JANAI62_23600 [Jannaschia sp. AI_62]